MTNLSKSSGHALLRLFRSKVRRQRLTQIQLVLKAIAFQCFSVLVTFLLTFFFTHNVEISFSVSMADTILKIVLYYVFDVSWAKLFYHF